MVVARPRLRRHRKVTILSKENMKSHSCSVRRKSRLFVPLSLQVCRCSPSSPKGNRRGVPAAIERLKTATCSRPWTNTGTRTVSNVPAATAVWGRWAPRSTPKPISSCVGETTYGKTRVRRCLSLTLTLELVFKAWNQGLINQ